MSQATGGLLEVNKRETDMVSRVPAHTQADTCTNTVTHTSVKLSNSPQRASLPQGKMPQREKQRDGMFSLHPPLSFSFSPPLAVVFSSALQCSTNMQSDQRVWGVRSEGQDGRVWKTRWEREAGEQSCQSNILSNSAELVSQWHASGLLSLPGGPSVYYHTSCFAVIPGLLSV